MFLFNTEMTIKQQTDSIKKDKYGMHSGHILSIFDFQRHVWPKEEKMF